MRLRLIGLMLMVFAVLSIAIRATRVISKAVSTISTTKLIGRRERSARATKRQNV